MELVRKYNQATHVYVPLVKRGVVDWALGADWTPAAGDVKLSKDGAAAVNVTNLPTAIAMGNGAVWDFSLTAAELQGAKIVVTVIDAATKAVEDQCFSIATFGHASAEYPPDLADAAALGLARLDAAISSRADGSAYTALRAAKLDNLDTNVGSRLATAGYTAPDNAGIVAAANAAIAADTKGAAIKAKTDTLPASPAATADIPTAVANATAVLAAMVEGTETLAELLRLVRAALVGRSDGFPAGPVHFRDGANTKNRITAQTDPDGNRTSVITDPS